MRKYSKHETDITSEHSIGHGGQTRGTGVQITWHDGARGQGAERKAQNGAYVEDVLIAAADRLQHFEDAGMGCAENRDAINHIQMALWALDTRARRREAKGVDGTMGSHEST